MTKYAEEIADALEAIEEAGTTLTLLRHPMEVDAAAGEKPWLADHSNQLGEGQLDEPEPHTITCVVLPASGGKIEALDSRLKSGTLILEQYRYLIIAASGLAVEPLPKDQVEYQGQTWTVIASTSLAPDGVPIIYKAAIRKGG
ncbi:hypothetical protein [Maricaulis sp. MIT060901]|uniref:hypothetical protein n=1 Tax=Maricaulis sp. MIT060901 TaxID=3096993 RepID=UPI00399B5EE9